MKHVLKWFLIMVFFVAGEGILHAGDAVIIGADTIKAAVRNYIETNMPWPAGTMRVEFSTRISDVVLAAAGRGKISYQVRSKKDEDFIGDSAFYIGFYEEGTPVKEDVVRVRMEVLRDVIVSSRVLVRDTPVSSHDINIVKKWVREVSLNTVAGPEDVVGKKICTSIRPNTEITSNMLKDIMMIKKGKLVQIMLENGLIRVTGIGVSEENGVYGAVIKVKTASSNKTILARVEGESLVRVDF
ncbi:MAG: flagellar basal body P-ring formation protein FlgA [Deltaproteobacteria bacterium]|nr:flagellar basal body P-ring formation protein FlgA [Deltaproteobacteria bacterium]